MSYQQPHVIKCDKMIVKMKKVKKPETTIDDLAMMVSRGFENAATKRDIHGIEQEMDGLEKGMNERFNSVDVRLQKIDDRLDHVEHHLVFGHTNRLEYLEDAVRMLKTKDGVH